MERIYATVAQFLPISRVESCAVILYTFREAGLIEKLFRDEMNKYNSAVATDGGQALTALTMENLQGGFLLLVLMTIFNILIFLIEVCIITTKVTSKLIKNDSRDEKLGKVGGRGIYPQVDVIEIEETLT